jgi:hypothetical protein
LTAPTAGLPRTINSRKAPRLYGRAYTGSEYATAFMLHHAIAKVQALSIGHLLMKSPARPS